MSAFLSFQWRNEENVCCFRALDNTNTNCLIALRVPWIQWPNSPLDDASSPWWVIQDKANLAVQQWKIALREKLSGEPYHKHMRITCILLMNEQLRLTVDSLGEGEEHMKLFYAFAADEVSKLEGVGGLDLGRDVVKWVGSGRDAYPVLRKFRNRTA